MNDRVSKSGAGSTATTKKIVWAKGRAPLERRSVPASNILLAAEL
jgi:hypothetical protein